MRKLIIIISVVLLFAMGWFSHMFIRGDHSSVFNDKKLDQDMGHTMTVPHHRIELETIKHRVMHNYPIYQREITDRRYCVWTDDQDKAMDMLKEFGSDLPDFELRKGEVLAIFMNDHITQVMTQIVHNKTAGKIFADYADSGISYDIENPQEGKKYTGATAVTFTPHKEPNFLGMRDMFQDGLSEKIR